MLCLSDRLDQSVDDWMSKRQEFEFLTSQRHRQIERALARCASAVLVGEQRLETRAQLQGERTGSLRVVEDLHAQILQGTEYEALDVALANWTILCEQR